MANSVEIRSYGRGFNEIADEYDRHRPAYPDALVDRACEWRASLPELVCWRSAAARAN
jgi:hypothetical protein